MNTTINCPMCEISETVVIDKRTALFGLANRLIEIMAGKPAMTRGWCMFEATGLGRGRFKFQLSNSAYVLYLEFTFFDQPSVPRTMAQTCLINSRDYIAELAYHSNN